MSIGSVIPWLLRGAGRLRRRAAATPFLAFAAILLLTPLASAEAQSTGRFQLLGGATFSELRDVGDLDLERRTSASGGIGLLLPFGSRLGLQPELWITGRGAEAAGGEPGDGLELTSLELPVLLRLSLGGDAALSPHVYAGPSFGYQIRCRIQDDGSESDCDDVPGVSTKTIDVNAVVGGGVDVSVGGIVLTGGLRYAYGLSPVADLSFDSVTENARSGAFTAYVGVGFRLGR